MGREQWEPNTYRKLACIAGGAVCLALLLGVVPAFAAAKGTSAAISQSYRTAGSGIVQGTLLSLTSKSSSTVIPANTTNGVRIVGIATSEPLIELTNGNQNTVQVAVSGTTDALVSDMNGPVYAGDRITASPVSGIGMKATAAGEIVGVTQASLDSVTTVTRSYAGTDGKQVSVKVGLLPVAVGVAYYSAAAQGNISAYVPPFLQSLANSIAGEAVSPLRVLIGAVALLLGFTAIVVMLYTGIHGGVISLGRNPLAVDALRRGMVDILITAVGVLIVTGVIVTVVITV